MVLGSRACALPHQEVVVRRAAEPIPARNARPSNRVYRRINCENRLNHDRPVMGQRAPGDIAQGPPVGVYLGQDRQLYRIRPAPTALDPQNLDHAQPDVGRIRRQ